MVPQPKGIEEDPGLLLSYAELSTPLTGEDARFDALRKKFADFFGAAPARGATAIDDDPFASNGQLPHAKTPDWREQQYRQQH